MHAVAPFLVNKKETKEYGGREIRDGQVRQKKRKENGGETETGQFSVMMHFSSVEMHREQQDQQIDPKPIQHYYYYDV